MTGKYTDSLHWRTCQTCGKRTYPTRKHARQARKAEHPDEKMRPYSSCDESGFHLGHENTLAREQEANRRALAIATNSISSRRR